VTVYDTAHLPALRILHQPAGRRVPPGQEPFVAPSGGRMDEIIRAVRDCPSGALSYGIDGEEPATKSTGTENASRQSKSPGRPYRSPAGFRSPTARGHDEQRNSDSSREHYALCRCGHLQNKPFCSGMYYYVRFADPAANPDGSRPSSSGPARCRR